MNVQHKILYKKIQKRYDQQNIHYGRIHYVNVTWEMLYNKFKRRHWWCMITYAVCLHKKSFCIMYKVICLAKYSITSFKEPWTCDSVFMLIMRKQLKKRKRKEKHCVLQNHSCQNLQEVYVFHTPPAKTFFCPMCQSYKTIYIKLL